MKFDFKTVAEEEFNLFVKNYSPYLSYGECFLNDIPVINYVDCSNAKKWPECLVCRIELAPEKAHLINKTYLND
jgi:hypothetical protein